MFYSHCLLSRNGPLAAIWVAAYSLKKLKKAEVTQTDISFLVDKILQDEFDVVTYRVLAYLLLGIVRIFSKKVEYLFSDCNKVLLKIKDFVVSNNGKALVETLQAPYFSITIPERFELDAFNLEILEDTIGSNMLPHEDITLEDSMLNAGAIVPYSLDKYHCEEHATCQDFHSATYNLSGDVLSSHQIDFDMEAGTSHNLCNSEASIEKLRVNIYSLHEPMDLEMFSLAEEELLHPVKSSPEKQRSEKEHTRVSEVEGLDEMHAALSMQEVWGQSICKEAFLNLEIFGEVEEETENPDKLFYKHSQTNGEEMEVADKAQSENENYQIKEDCNLINIEASMEKLRDNMVCIEEFGEMEMSHIVEEPPEFIRPFDEEHQSDTEDKKLLKTEELAEKTRSVGEEHQTAAGHKKTSDMTSGNRTCQFLTEDHPLSVTLNMTPKSKFLDASGVSAPEFLGIPTPAAKEGLRVQRKRKCLFDDVIVLPNNVIKQCIEDSSDLVCKRRKAPHTALAAWRACQVSSLPQCFWEPLIPYNSSELISLFCQKKIKIPASLDTTKLQQKFMPEYPIARSRAEDIQSLQKLDKSKASNDVRLIQTMNSLENLNVSASSIVGRFGETVEKADISESPAADRSLELTAIAPETPVQQIKSLRSFESPERPDISNFGVRLDSERLEGELSPSKEQHLDLNFMNEDVNSCGDEQDQYGLSERTRVVLRCLERSFLNQKKKKVEEVVNLMLILEGRTKKESARLFYEILVLKSKGYVHVEQVNAYGDILIWKTSKWEQECGGKPSGRSLYLES